MKLKNRRNNPVEGSYTSYLFREGLDKILKKVGEETTEVVIGAKNRDKAEVTSELSGFDVSLTCVDGRTWCDSGRCQK